MPGSSSRITDSKAFWSLSPERLVAALESDPERGLSHAEAAERLAGEGPNQLSKPNQADLPLLLLRQFSSPIVVILIIAALLSFALSDATDGVIILVIVLVSGLLGFAQERGAAKAMGALLQAVELQSAVLRDGELSEVPNRELVRGDVVLLRAGDGIPADCRLLSEQDLFVNQAALTGESFPVDKSPGVIDIETPLAQRSNMVHSRWET